MEEKTSKAPPKGGPLASASSLSRGLGDRLRRWASPQSPILRPFPIIDGDAINPRQPGKADPPATLSGSRPPMPHVSSNATLPPRPQSARKRATRLDLSRPDGAGNLWSVELGRWKSMSRRDQRRFWHVARIMSEEFGQPAVVKCKECERPTDSSEKMRLLKQCWVYKAGVAPCAGCIYSRKRCTFPEYAPDTQLSFEAAQLAFNDSPEQNGPDFPVGPTAESVPTALEQLSGSNWLGNTSINLLLKNVILLDCAHAIEIASPPGDSAGWQNFSGRYTAPTGCRLVLVPLYFSSNSHWTLLALDIANSRATFYDSLSLSPSPSPEHNVEAASFAIVKAFGHDWAKSRWSLHYATEGPLQGDSHSCGLVVLIVCMHLVAGSNIPKVVNSCLWRFLFRCALVETNARLNLTEAASNDGYRMDVRGPSSSQQESYNLSEQVEDAINLISLLRSQATIERRKLQFALSRAQDQNESAEVNVKRLGRKMVLRQAQLDNLLRAQDAANDLHEALESRLDDTCFGKDEYFSRPPKPANGPQQVGGGVRQRSGAQRPSYATSDVAATLKLQPFRWDTVLWVTVPDNPPFTETNTLSIQYFPGDVDALGHDVYLREALWTGLGREAVKKEDGGVYVHQGLATILAARSKEWFSVRLYQWDWLADQLQKNLPLTTCRGGDSTVVFIHATTEEPSNMSDVYEGIRYLAHAHGVSIRPYPSENEWRQQRMKIGDVRALDEIARFAPTQFSYRPKTCFGQGPCRLLDCETTVHKRSHSSGATHVMVREKGSPGELACMSVPQPDQSPGSPVKERMSLRPRNNPRKRAKSSDAPESCERKKHKQTHKHDHSSRIRTYWFHQEFVRNLYEGEFRVFIATRPDPQGIRGRSGYIVAIARTARHWETKNLAVRSVDDDIDFNRSSCGILTRRQLEEFSLFVFEGFRRRDDHLFFYESFEVGARLDIGVADDHQGRKLFFVNETTRWYNAHYFSQNLCVEPKSRICKAFAESFSDYVRNGMPNIP